MGNVLAASASGLSVPDPSLIPADMVSAIAADVKKIIWKNPGTVEELHSKCKDLQATTFEGARIMLNKGLSNHFQVSHTINMSTTGSNGYRFGATYVGTKQYGPTEAFPVLLGDIDSAGNLNANVIHQLTSRVRCKFASQFQDSRLVATQLTSDYRGDNFTASVTLGNPGLFTSSGVIVCQYLQAVTQSLALGSELTYQYGPNVPGRQVALVSAVGRYAHDDSVLSGSLGPGGLHLCFYQKASEQLQIGVEVETNLRVMESVATIAYQIDLPKADLVFRGSVDSNWQCCGVLEKRLQPLPFSLAFSGRMNHVKNKFNLGCGLMIG